jgi:hypothetical protein
MLIVITAVILGFFGYSYAAYAYSPSEAIKAITSANSAIADGTRLPYAWQQAKTVCGHKWGAYVWEVQVVHNGNQNVYYCMVMANGRFTHEDNVVVQAD